MTKRAGVYRVRRADANQPEVAKAYRDIGCVVVDIHEMGEGVPDLLIAVPAQRAAGLLLPCDGLLLLSEVKGPGEGLTGPEAKLHELLRGYPVVVDYSGEDVLRRFGLL